MMNSRLVDALPQRLLLATDMSARCDRALDRAALRRCVRARADGGADRIGRIELARCLPHITALGIAGGCSLEVRRAAALLRSV